MSRWSSPSAIRTSPCSPSPWSWPARADGYADNTVKAYQNAVRSLADWLAEHHPEVGPAELDRQHLRGWLVEVREGHSSNTARGWFAGVRHFCRWLESEGEADHNATAGIRTPAPGDPETPVLSDQRRSRLVWCCPWRSAGGPVTTAVNGTLVARPVGTTATRALA
jgi:Phage integrase, N-terminal SAM-like domain